ncbi:hypothetical protein AN416_07090 [Paraburkholderia caribensis]|nr:hypothetical protein AN416_07090 [Paraburkholderia caribensis]AUT53484.1 hypothetical protein C2L66_11330 [Paraburkholderia caribensis]
MNVRGQFSDPIADPQVTLGALAFADDLGRLLWRMKYGQDVKRSGLHRATLLLANRIRWSGKYARKKFTGLDQEEVRLKRAGKKVERALADIVERFARRVIIEWVADLCPDCNGSGVKGRVQRQRAPLVVTVTCPACHGTRFNVLSEERIPFAHNGRAPMVFLETQRCDTCNGEGSTRVEQKPKRDGRQICDACGGNGRSAIDEPARALALGVSLTSYRAHWAQHFRGLLASLDAIDGRATDVVRRQVQR